MTDVAIPDSEVFQRFLAAAETSELEQNPEQVAIDVIARILNADSVADVLGGGGATHARDYLNTPFVLVGVKFNRSTVDQSNGGFYAILEGADDAGEKVAVTCGAKNVIAQAWKLQDMDALPLRVELKQSSKPTANGFFVMWLEAAAPSF